MAIDEKKVGLNQSFEESKMIVEVERTSSIGSDSSNNNNLKPTPTHHHPNGTSFRNPWPSSSSSPSSVGLNQLFNGSIRIEMARRIESDVEPIRTVESQLESFYKDGDVNDDGCGLVGTWIGHAVCPKNLNNILSSSSSDEQQLSRMGFLIQLPDLKTEDLKGGSIRIRLLFDPIFSNRAGPNQFIGTRRFQSAPPFKLKNLPRIDYCLISHNHYDHLDYETIKQLYKYQPQINYFVPLGLKAWFNSVPIPSSRVVELDWWESFDPLRGLVSNSKLKATLVCDLKEGDDTVENSNDCYQSPSSTSNSVEASSSTKSVKASDVSRKEIPERCDDDGEDSLIISCVPAQHSSGRTLLDQNSSLWCGWVVKKSRQPSCASSVVMDRVKVYDERLVKNDKDDRVANEKVKDCTIYFAGDTGYRSLVDQQVICPAFKEIGSRFGPIDFSMIPIWRGGSLSFLSWAGLKVPELDFLLSTHHVTGRDSVRIHRDVRSRRSIGIHHSCFVGSSNESVESIESLRRACLDEGVEFNFRKVHGFGVSDVGESFRLEL